MLLSHLICYMKNSLTPSNSHTASTSTKTLKLGKPQLTAKAKPTTKTATVQAETRTFETPVLSQSNDFESSELVKTQVQSVTVVTKRRSRLAVVVNNTETAEVATEDAINSEVETEAHIPEPDNALDALPMMAVETIENVQRETALEATSESEPDMVAFKNDAPAPVIKVKKKKLIAKAEVNAPAATDIAGVMEPVIAEEMNKPAATSKARIAKAPISNAESNKTNTTSKSAAASEIDTSAYAFPTTSVCLPEAADLIAGDRGPSSAGNCCFA